VQQISIMATASLLPSTLQNTLNELLERTNKSGAGIRAILLSTTEGVPLGRVYADDDQPLNEDVLASIESIWAPSSKQLPFLGLKKAQQVTAIYDHGALIHVYQTPLVCRSANSERQCVAGELLSGMSHKL
jgi:Mitogen-activated protein kinase kinase 1 interacting